MFYKALLTVGLACCALSAVAQTHYQGDPNILLPTSGVPKAGHAITHYLVYVGPRLRRSLGMTDRFGTRGPALLAQSGGPDGYHPADVQAAYQIPANQGSQAIAIVDAFDNPTALSDFNTFSTQFGLPTETSSIPTASTNKVFQVVYASGSQPSADAGWAGEIALDIEWAHAMAPKAKIYLIEAADSSIANLFGAVNVAKALLNVKEVSMSFGIPGETPDEASIDPTFIQGGVVFLSSSGDFGGVQSYPAESPNVVGVGGTSIQISPTGTVTSEVAWDGSGGGPSQYEPRPLYQSVITSIVGSNRGCPDIAAIADPNTGAAVYSQTAFGGWSVIGGTSLACPVCAGITNVRGQFANSSAEELTRVYKNYGTKLYRDIISGSAGGFTAKVGWDFITGVGCPIGLYPTVAANPYLPTAVSVLTGTLSSGNLASIQALDGNLYSVLSAATPPQGPTAAATVDFQLDKSPSSFASLNVVTSAIAPQGTTIQVFAMNWSTGRYDVLQANPGRGAVTTFTASFGSKLSAYDNNGLVRLAIRVIAPVRSFTPSLSLGIDQVMLTATLNPSTPSTSPSSNSK